MIQPALPAFFLWVGSLLPDMARASILSAAEAGFETVLFTDRSQNIHHPKLTQTNWREVDLPWSPEEVRLRGEGKPCFAAFSDLFRYAVLAKHDGWWFDCDTILLRNQEAFDKLLLPGNVTVGLENDVVVNGAVLGSRSKDAMQLLFEQAMPAFPILDSWGVVGPSLISNLIAEDRFPALVLRKEHFYPIHHSDIAQVFLPEYRETFKAEQQHWYCLSLWGEVLSRSGLKHLAPPQDSYLGDLLSSNPALGEIRTDPVELANYLERNLHKLETLESGRVALRTLLRKAKSKIFGVWP